KEVVCAGVFPPKLSWWLHYKGPPDDPNTFMTAVKCPSATLRRHCLMIVFFLSFPSSTLSFP
ncbi:hypothetical protein A2U01_0066994, partial [Trifolium medium]|nr:hypothetical protein [Trifolium medium]